MDTEALTVILLLLMLLAGLVVGYGIGHDRGYSQGRYDERQKQSLIVTEYEREVCRLLPGSILAEHVRLRLETLHLKREIKRYLNATRIDHKFQRHRHNGW